MQGVLERLIVLLATFSGSDAFLSRLPFRRNLKQITLAISPEPKPDPPQWWSVEVSSEFDSPQSLHAAFSEPLLHVAERAGMTPSNECRRGNCLSCAARLLPGSSLNFRTDDVFLCNDAKARGYLLTCSTYATGPGLRIELEKNYEASMIQYHDRFTSAQFDGVDNA